MWLPRKERAFVILVIAIISNVTGTQSTFLKMDAPVLWEKINTPVSEGILHTELEIFLVSPCSAITNATVHPDLVQATISECNIKYAELLRTVEVGCQGMVTSVHTTSLLMKDKRFIPLVVVGVMAGVVVVTGFVSHNYVVSSKNAGLIRDIDRKMGSLANQATASIELLRKETNEAIDKIYVEVNRVLGILEQVPKQSFLISTLNFKIERGIEETKKSFLSWKKNQPGSGFFEHFNVSLPCKDTCPLDKADIISCKYNPDAESIRFRADIPKVKTSLVLMQAKSFRMMQKENNITCSYTYVGPKYAVVSKKSHCVYPLRELSLYKNSVLIIPDMICGSSDLGNTNQSHFFKQEHCEQSHPNDEASFFHIEKQYNVYYVYCPGFAIEYGNFSTPCSYHEVHAVPVDVHFRVQNFVNNATVVHIDVKEKEDQHLSYKANSVLRPIYKAKDVHLKRGQPIVYEGIDITSHTFLFYVFLAIAIFLAILLIAIIVRVKCCRQSQGRRSVNNFNSLYNSAIPVELSFLSPE